MRRIFKAQEYIAHKIFYIILGVKTRNCQVLLNFPIQILNKEKNRGLAADAVATRMADFVHDGGRNRGVAQCRGGIR